MDELSKRQGANLPHWTRDGATYFVTYRLADSLPAAAIKKIRSESAMLDRQVAMASVPLTPEQLLRNAKLKSDQYLKLLDEGHGQCVLRRPEIAQIVADGFRYFDGKRYCLAAWCIMPNHVHVVFTVIPGEELSAVLHSWKSFTAKAANKLLGRHGAFWQAESFDHLVRDQADFDHAVSYTLQNPAAAGLRNWPWVWGANGD